MFLVVKYHIIRPPPPAWARLLNKPKSQKIVGHWIPKSWWTMNFQNFMDHEFVKFHGHWFSFSLILQMIFPWGLKKWLGKYVLIFLLNYCVIWWLFWKQLFFLIQSILFCNGFKLDGWIMDKWLNILF